MNELCPLPGFAKVLLSRPSWAHLYPTWVSLLRGFCPLSVHCIPPPPSLSPFSLTSLIQSALVHFAVTRNFPLTSVPCLEFTQPRCGNIFLGNPPSARPTPHHVIRVPELSAGSTHFPKSTSTHMHRSRRSTMGDSRRRHTNDA